MPCFGRMSWEVKLCLVLGKSLELIIPVWLPSQCSHLCKMFHLETVQPLPTQIIFISNTLLASVSLFLCLCVSPSLSLSHTHTFHQKSFQCIFCTFPVPYCQWEFVSGVRAIHCEFTNSLQVLQVSNYQICCRNPSRRDFWRRAKRAENLLWISQTVSTGHIWLC